jgi:hypothetical protein
MLDLTTVVDAKGGGILSIAASIPTGCSTSRRSHYQKDALLIGSRHRSRPTATRSFSASPPPVQALHQGRVEPGA